MHTGPDDFDDTVARVLAATFGRVADDLATDHEHGRLTAVGADGYRQFEREDEAGNAVLTATRPARPTYAHSIPGVGLADLR